MARQPNSVNISYAIFIVIKSARFNTFAILYLNHIYKRCLSIGEPCFLQALPDSRDYTLP